MTAIAAREVGTTGVEVTILGLGGAPLGDFSELIPEDRAAATVEAAWAAGIRYSTRPRFTATDCPSIASGTSFVANRAIPLC